MTNQTNLNEQPQPEYEVTWGMVYNATSPRDALRQALGDLSQVIAIPTEGPNMFVIRRTNKPVDDSTMIVIEASKALADYWCDVCDSPIIGEDINDIHTTDDGEDCHAECCQLCANWDVI